MLTYPYWEQSLTFKTLMPRKGLEKGWFLRKKTAHYLQIVKPVSLLKNFGRQTGIFFEERGKIVFAAEFEFFGNASHAVIGTPEQV